MKEMLPPPQRAPYSLNKAGRGFHVILWALQIFLAIFFVSVGLMKLSSDGLDLSESTGFEMSSIWLLRLIGFFEVLGAIGLILPSLLKVKPKLSILAALALALVMLLASLHHLQEGEMEQAKFTAILMALNLFVVWGRVRRAPIF